MLDNDSPMKVVPTDAQCRTMLATNAAYRQAMEAKYATPCHTSVAAYAVQSQAKGVALLTHRRSSGNAAPTHSHAAAPKRRPPSHAAAPKKRPPSQVAETIAVPTCQAMARCGLSKLPTRSHPPVAAMTMVTRMSCRCGGSVQKSALSAPQRITSPRSRSASGEKKPSAADLL